MKDMRVGRVAGIFLLLGVIGALVRAGVGFFQFLAGVLAVWAVLWVARSIQRALW